MSYEVRFQDCDTVTIHRTDRWLDEYVETGIHVDPNTLWPEVGRIVIDKPGSVSWSVPEAGYFYPAAWHKRRLVHVWQCNSYQLGHALVIGPFPLKFEISSV